MQLPRRWLMRLRDLANWPPVWVRLGTVAGKSPKALTGEVGVLQKVRTYPERRGRMYLTMHLDRAVYVGCLVVENERFCLRLAEHLRRCCGMRIDEVGGSELISPHTPRS